MRIVINEKDYEVTRVSTLEKLPRIACGREEYFLAESAEKAGEAARELWHDMYLHDIENFKCLVGEDVVEAWACGELAGPGKIKVRSVDAWLAVVATYPAEEFADYDGISRIFRTDSVALSRMLGFSSGFAYRCA